YFALYHKKLYKFLSLYKLGLNSFALFHPSFIEYNKVYMYNLILSNGKRHKYTIKNIIEKNINIKKTIFLNTKNKYTKRSTMQKLINAIDTSNLNTFSPRSI